MSNVKKLNKDDVIMYDSSVMGRIERIEKLDTLTKLSEAMFKISSLELDNSPAHSFDEIVEFTNTKKSTLRKLFKEILQDKRHPFTQFRMSGDRQMYYVSKVHDKKTFVDRCKKILVDLATGKSTPIKVEIV